MGSVRYSDDYVSPRLLPPGAFWAVEETDLLPHSERLKWSGLFRGKHWSGCDGGRPGIRRNTEQRVPSWRPISKGWFQLSVYLWGSRGFSGGVVIIHLPMQEAQKTQVPFLE